MLKHIAKAASQTRQLSAIKKDLQDTMSSIEDLVSEFSDLRFEVSDLAELGNKEAEKLYEGWTREVHNKLAQALEVAGIHT